MHQYAYYAKMMLERFGFTNCKPVSTPMEKSRATTDKNKKLMKNIFSIVK